MFDPTNPAAIFVPVLVVVALTLVALFRMGAGRGAAMKAGQDPNYYRAHIGTPEPEGTVVAVRHYGNLMEMPTLFYAGCISAYVLEGVTGWALGFAWAYVVLRLIQSLVHLTYNNPGHRGIAFILGSLCVFALWVTVAIAVCAQL